MAKPASRAMRLMRRFLILAVVLAAGAGYLVWQRPWMAKPSPVERMRIAEKPASEVLAVNGQIVPSTTVDLASPVSGQIASVAVNTGDSVEKGQILVRLDDAIARAAANQADAALAAATVSLNEAELKWTRAKALGSTISTQSRDNARFAFETAKANVQKLQAARTQAERQLDQHLIRAPIDGTVLKVDAEPGQVVGTSGTLIELGDMKAPEIETDVDEVYGARIAVGQSARVAPVGQSDPLAARVSFVAPTVDPDTGGRTIKLRFETPPKTALPAGLTMSVNIVVERFDKAILIPRTAILGLGDVPYVLLDDHGKAVKRDIAVSDWPAARLIVKKGLEPGDRLILDPKSVSVGSPVVAAE